MRILKAQRTADCPIRDQTVTTQSDIFQLTIQCMIVSMETTEMLCQMSSLYFYAFHISNTSETKPLKYTRRAFGLQISKRQLRRPHFWRTIFIQTRSSFQIILTEKAFC